MSNLMRGFSLNGQVALVTGASRGIGRTLAIALADAGARVVLAARDQAAMLEVAATIEAAGGTCSTLYLDVTDAQSRTAAFEQLLQREGRLDILLNNAGVEQIKPALSWTR